MSTVIELLKVIPYGKQNAIHAGDIARQLNLPTDGNQVEVRALIGEAIRQGNIILSNTNVGYWRSDNKKEVEKYIHSLDKRANEISDRSDAIKKGWNATNPNNIISK